MPIYSQSSRAAVPRENVQGSLFLPALVAFHLDCLAQDAFGNAAGLDEQPAVHMEIVPAAEEGGEAAPASDLVVSAEQVHARLWHTHAYRC